MKASRVCALCLVAGSLAGLTGGRVLAQSPAELQKEIDDLRHMQSVLSKPGMVITPMMDGLLTFDRDDFSQLMGSLVSRGELSPAQVQRLVFRSVAMTKIARDLVAKELEEKEQALARLTAQSRKPDAAFWLTYSGTVHGSFFNVVCRTSSGNERPGQTGKFAFEFIGDGSLSVLEAAPARGRVTDDGSMSARGDGASTTWWGRFRRENNGTISGKGEFATQTASERCDGNWSVP